MIVIVDLLRVIGVWLLVRHICDGLNRYVVDYSVSQQEDYILCWTLHPRPTSDVTLKMARACWAWESIITRVCLAACNRFALQALSPLVLACDLGNPLWLSLSPAEPPHLHNLVSETPITNVACHVQRVGRCTEILAMLAMMVDQPNP